MKSISGSEVEISRALLKLCCPADAPLHAWSMACGIEVLAHARGAAFEGSRLIVVVESIEWKRELESLAGQYLKKIQALIKIPVSQIVFVTSYEPCSKDKKP